MTKHRHAHAALSLLAFAAQTLAAPAPGHFEQISMPPVPAEWLSLRAESAGGVIVFGPHVSIQVNVNGSGNNILGDAANEPTIAVDPTSPERIAIAWRQFDTIESNFRQAGIAYSDNGGASWTFSGVLDPGQFRSDPVLASDAAGNLYYSSLSSVTTAEVFKSADGGVTWGPPVAAHGGDKQWLAVDDRPVSGGHVYQVWNSQFSCCGGADFTRSINGGASFQAPIHLPNPRMKWGTLDVGPDGTLYLAGATLDQQGHLFTKSGSAQDPELPTTFAAVTSIFLGGTTSNGGTPNPGGLLGQVWVATHPTLAGHVYVLASVNPPGPDPLDVMFIRTVDDGETWSAPIRVNDDASSGNWQWFGTMSVAPSGRIDVVWNDTRVSGVGTQSALFYSYSADEGQSWTSNVQVTPTYNSTVGWPQQNKMGDYYHSISDAGGVNVAYAATFNGEQDVYFIRIPIDCNQNEIDDNCDLACGVPGGPCDVLGCGLSDDCNGNTVPDDCEPPNDCNNNAILDICEIADDPTLDCNGNLLIDTCESPADCNDNNLPDICDIFDGSSVDCNGNLVPDECEPPQAPNDLCVDAIALPSVASQAVPFDNTCAETDGPPTVNCPSGQPFGADMWYTFQAPCTASFQISTCGDADFDMMLAVYGGASACTCPTGSTAPLVCGDDTCGIGSGPAAVTVNMTYGRCYTIRLGGWSNAKGSGTLEVNALGVCEPPLPVAPEPDGVDKNRFISFLVNGDGSPSSALRVRLTSLHHPVPLPAGGPPPDFSALEGEFRYVNLFRDGANNPIFDCPDSLGHPAYKCARLGCAPEYRDWVAELNAAVLQVTGDAVVPSSIYQVSHLPSACMGTEETCAQASAELEVGTARWGNVNGDTQLGAIDIAFVIDKVKAVPGSAPECRALLEPQALNPASKNANASDIGRSVDAVKGFPYPFGIGVCP